MRASLSLQPPDRYPGVGDRSPTTTHDLGTNKTCGPRVLVVDDDAPVLKLLARALAARGHRVSGVSSASAGLALVGAAPPDLLLLDLKLPDMSGVALLRVLRLRGVTCRVVILSGFLTSETAEHVAGLGVVRLITKPVRPNEVAEIVDVALRMPLHSDAAPPTADVAHRWAALVLRASEGDADVRTIEEWARRSGVSAGTLRELCRILRIPPHDAKDLARLLNALLRAHRYQATMESMLDVSDRRTLDRLLARAGLEGRLELLTVTAFLDRQHWIPKENAGLRALRAVFEA